MQPCGQCNKPTRSHPLGHITLCHTCYEALSPKDREFLEKQAAEIAVRAAIEFAEMMARARATHEKPRRMLLAENVELVESNIPITLSNKKED